MPLKTKQQISRLSKEYLFIEIAQKCRQFQARHPEVELLKLGIGDVSQALPPIIAQALAQSAIKMAETKGMQGYGSEHGKESLKKAIVNSFYSKILASQEIFIQDGSKPAFARLLASLENSSKIATFSPTYPAFFDVAHCYIEQLNFFYLSSQDPELALKELDCNPPDLFILCHPNNPDGKTFSNHFLTRLIAIARKHQFLIVHDSAYASYICDQDFSSTLYTLPYAKECVIEIGSLSKSHGFTGLRLGWLCLPQELTHQEFRNNAIRLFECSFNGASCVIQDAAIAALSASGMAQARELQSIYMKHRNLLHETLIELQWHVNSSPHTPYIWARPQNSSKTSWELFDKLLHNYGIVCTPGIGFGLEGEGWVRFSGFADSQTIDIACRRLSQKKAILS